MRGKDIAMIFQEPMTSLNPVLTIGSQIAEVLLLHEQISRQQARDKGDRHAAARPHPGAGAARTANIRINCPAACASAP